MADLDAALLEEVLDVAQGQREPDIHHDSQSDYFRTGLEVSEWVDFCHVTTLGDRQPPRKNFALTVPNRATRTNRKTFMRRKPGHLPARPSQQ